MRPSFPLPFLGWLTSLLVLHSNDTLLAQSRPDSLKNNIKRAVINLIDNQAAVGTVIAFLENGKEDYFVYGLANQLNKQAITKQSVFDIGSITKTFTSLLLADLVAKGKVKLEDPVQKFLPNSVRMPTYKGQPITLISLATHTSGLPSYPPNFEPKDLLNSIASFGTKELYAFLNSYQLTRGVGTPEYSNLGVGLLGHTLTLITGKSYAQLVQEIILTPLQMSESSTTTKSPYLTVGHVDNRAVAHWDLDVFAGAGAVRSNAVDMMRYLKAQMSIQPASLKTAIELTQQPRLDVDKNTRFCLGWALRSAGTDEFYLHNGATPGYTAFMGFSRKTNKAIIILNNSEQSLDELGMYFFDPSVKLTLTKKAITVPLLTLQQYVGQYELEPGVMVDVKLEGDHLMVKLGNQDYMREYAESESRFFSRGTPYSFAFFKNDKGEVDKLVLYVDGEEHPAKRK